MIKRVLFIMVLLIMAVALTYSYSEAGKGEPPPYDYKYAGGPAVVGTFTCDGTVCNFKGHCKNEDLDLPILWSANPSNITKENTEGMYIGSLANGLPVACQSPTGAMDGIIAVVTNIELVGTVNPVALVKVVILYIEPR